MESKKSAFILPALLVYGTFVCLPILQTIYLSLCTYTGMTESTFSGLDNYFLLLKDPIFYRAFGNSVLLAILSVAIQIPIALLLALALYKKSKINSFLRALVFSPLLVPSTVIAAMFAIFYNPYDGLITAMVGLFKDGMIIDFLGDESLAMLAIILAISWRHIGFHLLLLIAGLNYIDQSVIDAADVDGAKFSQKLRYVIIPMLAPSLLLSCFFAVLGSLKYFDLVFLITKGGPNHQTELITTYLYKEGFGSNHFGYASAMAVVLLFSALIIAFIIHRLRRRFV